MTYRPKSVALATGVTLPYVEQGDPSGLPVVFLHGYTDSWRSWALLLDELPGSIHALALTQRGHGDADRPDDGYSAGQVTGDVAAFMDAVGLEAAVVCGHSGGAYTAQRYAIDHAERTSALVLLGAPCSLRDNAVAAELAQAVSELDDRVDPDFVHEFQAGMAQGPLPDGFLAASVAESLKVPARIWKAALHGLLEAEVPTELGPLTPSTLLLWGDRDPVASRADQEALLAASRDARLIVYEGAGHSLHWEQPERVAADMVAYTAALGDGLADASAALALRRRGGARRSG